MASPGEVGAQMRTMTTMRPMRPTTTPDASTAGRKDATMSQSTSTPSPVDGLTPDQLSHAVRLLRPERATALTPVSVTMAGAHGAVTVLSDDSVRPEPGTVGVTVAQLRRLHQAGEGWRFGDKPCPFC